MVSPIYTGGPAIRLCWRPERVRQFENRLHRVGEGPYMEGVESGQRLFAILFREDRNWLNWRGIFRDLLVEPFRMGQFFTIPYYRTQRI